MKKIVLIVFMCLSGCTVMQDAKTEFRREIVGFKTEWDRVILKKDVVHE